jgi:hypothetical protein
MLSDSLIDRGDALALWRVLGEAFESACRPELLTFGFEALTEIGVLAETTGKRRDRSFAYRAYMERLRTGTDLNSRD